MSWEHAWFEFREAKLPALRLLGEKTAIPRPIPRVLARERRWGFVGQSFHEEEFGGSSRSVGGFLKHDRSELQVYKSSNGH